MEIISETMEITEMPEEKSLKVKWTRVDKVTPLEYIQNYEQLKKSIEEANKRLEELDAQKEQVKKQLEEQIKIHNPRIEALEGSINKAKVWNEEIKQENERRKKGKTD